MIWGDLVDTCVRFLERIGLAHDVAVNFATDGIALLVTNSAFFSTVGLWRFVSDRFIQLRCRSRANIDASTCYNLAFWSGTDLFRCVKFLALEGVETFGENQELDSKHIELSDIDEEQIRIYLANFGIALNGITIKVRTAISERVTDYFEFRKGFVKRPEIAYQIVDVANNFCDRENLLINQSNYKIFGTRKTDVGQKVRLLLFYWIETIIIMSQYSPRLANNIIRQLYKTTVRTTSNLGMEEFGEARSIIVEMLKESQKINNREEAVPRIAEQVVRAYTKTTAT